LNTAVVGYQEMLTDTTNAGRILVLTYPLIGNYGVNAKFDESRNPLAAGMVIKEKSQIDSNWMSKGRLDSFLKEKGVCAVEGIDTRTVAVGIRDDGEMLGIISDRDFDKDSLLKKIADFKKRPRRGYVRDISVKTITEVKNPKAGTRVAVYDIGIGRSFVRQLERLGCALTLLPYDTEPAEAARLKAKALVIPNGPEDDDALGQVAESVRYFIGKLPVLGFSTGHLVIARALGARVRRMKIGHHGVNYPVMRKGCAKGSITVQNHSWEVDEKSVKRLKDVDILETNLNDDTVEAIASRRRRILSVQYYPASPGFDEVNSIFREFVSTIK
jgi:carbamoyl-phosphate synthase small subunit